MKEIRTDQVLETKIRIYGTYLLERLSAYYEKHRKGFRSKNDLYIHLIQNGLELAEIQDENYGDYNGKIQSISDKLTEILSAIQSERVAFKDILNGKIVNGYITEKILSRIYNLLLGLNEELPLSKEYLEAGMYDDLPKELIEFKDELLEVYGRKSKKNVGQD